MLVRILDKLDRIEQQQLNADDLTTMVNNLLRTCAHARCPVCDHKTAPEQEAPPVHVDIPWVLDYLDVSRATFYRSVKDKLLFPVAKIGIRPYYLRSDVVALMAKHEKGAWTFSKLGKQKMKGSGAEEG